MILPPRRPLAAPSPLRRRRLTKPPRSIRAAGAERRYARTLRRTLGILPRLVRELVLPELPRIVAAAPAELRTTDALEATRADAFGVVISIVFGGVRLAYERETRVLPSIVEGHARDTANHEREQLGRQTRAVLGIDPEAGEPWLAAVLDDAVRDNVAEIGAPAERYLSELETMVRRSVRDGQRHEDLADEIRQRFASDTSPEAQRLAARADLIARNQTARLTSDLARVRQKALGVERYIWRTSLDERVRPEHVAREGKIFRWDAPPSDGHPGEPINCVPGDAPVSLHAPAVMAFRRWYHGELTLLVTGAGEPLRVTPNHPVLTQRGWLPAHLVEVGDYLVETPTKRLEAAVADPQRGDATAAEAFGALRAIGVAHRVAGGAARFHGDVSDQDVDVVEVDGRLFDRGEAVRAQRFGEEGLAGPAELALSLGHAAPGVIALLRPADSIVRAPREPLPLLARGAAHPREHRVTPPADRNSGVDQHATDGRARDAELLGDRELALPGAVELHDLVTREVKAVMREPFAGLVYNFTTTTGWFGSHGLIIHNCRCTAEPVLDDLLDDDAEG